MAKDKTEKPAAKPNPKIILVFIGFCNLVGHKKGGSFYQMTEEQWATGALPEDPTERIFDLKVAKKGGQPGSVYSVQTPPDRPQSIYPDTLRWVGVLQDTRVVEWQVRSNLIQAEWELRAKEKTGKHVNLVKEQCAPLRQVYEGLVGRNRSLFIAQVVTYITRG